MRNLKALCTAYNTNISKIYMFCFILFLYVVSDHYYSKRACWLQSYGLYFGFLVPVGVILLINIVITGMVIHELKNNKKMKVSYNQ